MYVYMYIYVSKLTHVHTNLFICTIRMYACIHIVTYKKVFVNMY
jgi:hypothetical protein